MIPNEYRHRVAQRQQTFDAVTLNGRKFDLPVVSSDSPGTFEEPFEDSRAFFLEKPIDKPEFAAAFRDMVSEKNRDKTIAPFIAASFILELQTIVADNDEGKRAVMIAFFVTELHLRLEEITPDSLLDPFCSIRAKHSASRFRGGQQGLRLQTGKCLIVLHAFDIKIKYTG